MSLAINPKFPCVNGLSLIVGAAYGQLTSFLVQRPVFGAVWKKAQIATSPKEVIEAKEGQTAAVSILSSTVSSFFQSYGVNALLHLTNVISYKGAAIVGALLFAVQSGPQLVQSVLVTKSPVDVIVSTVAVQLLDTVGLALALQAYNQRFGDSIVKHLN